MSNSRESLELFLDSETLKNTVYLDTETSINEVVELAIYDNNGLALIDTLIKPGVDLEWPDQFEIHGIAPAEVVDSPSLESLSSQIADAVNDRIVVIYNKDFDLQYLGNLLCEAKSIECCMIPYADHFGDWDDWFMSNRWQKLDRAIIDIHYKPEGPSHRAGPDALKCRAVWLYLYDKNERSRINAIDERIEFDHIVESELFILEQRAYLELVSKLDKRQKQFSTIIERWRGAEYNSHPACKLGFIKKEDYFSEVFFGKTLRLLKLEDKYSEIYRRKKDIPDNLKRDSFFPDNEVFNSGLVASAAYVGKKQGWELFNISEIKRLNDKYPLRVNRVDVPEGKILATVTMLRKMKYTRKQIESMDRSSEYYHRKYCEWYGLYLVDDIQK